MTTEDTTTNDVVDELQAPLGAVVDDATARERLVGEVRDRLKKKISKMERLLAKLDGDLKKLEAHKDAGRYGELLKSVLGTIKRGAMAVDVYDWEKNERVLIPLDPACDARQNMERLFVKRRRLERGRVEIAQRRAGLTQSISALKAEYDSIETLDLDTLLAKVDAREATGPKAGVGPPSRPKAKSKSGIERFARKFVSEDGHLIFVGRSAAANDRLTLSHTRGHDLWFHASQTAGAHVVLAVAQKSGAVPIEAILDAAHLAAHYSGLKGGGAVEVIYTQARYVRKMKGMKPGLVAVSHAKTLRVRVDEARIRRLMQSSPKSV